MNSNEYVPVYIYAVSTSLHLRCTLVAHSLHAPDSVPAIPTHLRCTLVAHSLHAPDSRPCDARASNALRQTPMMVCPVCSSLDCVCGTLLPSPAVPLDPTNLPIADAVALDPEWRAYIDGSIDSMQRPSEDLEYVERQEEFAADGSGPSK